MDRNTLYDPTHRCDAIREYHNISPSLTARSGTGGGNLPCVIERGEKNMSNYCIAGNSINRKVENGQDINKFPCMNSRDFIIKQIVDYCGE